MNKYEKFGREILNYYRDLGCYYWEGEERLAIDPIAIKSGVMKEEKFSFSNPDHVKADEEIGWGFEEGETIYCWVDDE